MVSPARAGMDLQTYGVPTSLFRFPRTRGDGPLETQYRTALKAFPPHARGWTSFDGSDPRWEIVSPARAGMDLDHRGPV